MKVTEARTRQIIHGMTHKANEDVSYCSYYGEPGYTQPREGVILANWNNFKKRTADYLEAAGYELEWSDEWTIDYDNDKAYRTSPDSYFWRPAFIYTEGGDMLTPDDDEGDVIEEVAIEKGKQKDAIKCLPNWITQDHLKAAGYEPWEDGKEYETGLHHGQDDSPDKVAKEIFTHDGITHVCFFVNDKSQFDIRWCAFVKRHTEDD